MKKILAFTLAFAALLLAISTPARADAEVEQIFAKTKAINKGLQDYKADINISLNAKVSIIPYNTKMSGSYYHKVPDKHKLVLENAPNYVKKYPNIFGWNLPKLEKFHSRVSEVTTIGGQKAWHIDMLPKQGMGDIENVEIWINCENYTVPRQVTHYKRNGRLAVDVSYSQKNGYWVFDKMSAEFVFPAVSVNATATAQYSNYEFNLGLTDDFFPKK